MPRDDSLSNRRTPDHWINSVDWGFLHLSIEQIDKINTFILIHKINWRNWYHHSYTYKSHKFYRTVGIRVVNDKHHLNVSEAATILHFFKELFVSCTIPMRDSSAVDIITKTMIKRDLKLQGNINKTYMDVTFMEFCLKNTNNYWHKFFYWKKKTYIDVTLKEF